MGRGFFILLSLISLNIASQSNATQSNLFISKWNDYVASAQKTPLQEQCKPKWIHASSDTGFRGTVILHHGFTACPQQFFEWGEMLSRRGFDVLLPTLPGHGRVLIDPKKNKVDLTAYPTRENWKSQYMDYTRELNAIMAVSSGTRVVGGLSVGGETALGAALNQPYLYDRLILMSPFFELSRIKTTVGKNADLTTRFLSNFKSLNEEKSSTFDDWSSSYSWMNWYSHARQSWGPDCEKTETQLGRQGYCQFTIDSISANQYYGRWLLTEVSKASHLPPMQIIAVERDGTASTDLMHDLIGFAQPISGQHSQICFFRNDANHSLLSKFDSPKQDKYWIPFLEYQATRFVVDGTPVDARGTVKDEYPSQFCDAY